MIGITCQDAFRRTARADFDWFRLRHRSDGDLTWPTRTPEGTDAVPGQDG